MIWVKIASLMMFLGVALGAFGSHALRGRMISDYYFEVYKTGVLYHFIHAIGLFIVAWLSMTVADPKLNVAGIFMLLGIILFSGSLYALSLTGNKMLGMITPIGGVCFLIAWTLLIFVRNYL
jgi:uncharacterized membrane protein YgdD (TMEM256/DUF423 family)